MSESRRTQASEQARSEDGASTAAAPDPVGGDVQPLAREDVRIHGLVAWHPDAAGRPTGELCIHARSRPYEDAERPVATVCDALDCVKLVDPHGVLAPGTWCTVFGTSDAHASAESINPDAEVGHPPVDDFHERREFFTVAVDHLGEYPEELRDHWSEYTEDGSGYGFIELSAAFARRRSRRTSHSPLRTTPRLLDHLVASEERIRASRSRRH